MNDNSRQSVKTEVTPGAVALQIEVATLRTQLEDRAAEVAMLKERVSGAVLAEERSEMKRLRDLTKMVNEQLRY